jgi:hypothetical protein
MNDPDELKAELAAIEAEAIGWLPLGEGAYLHVGRPDEEEVMITVVGVGDVGMVCPGQVFSNSPIGSQPLKPAQTQV